MKIFRPQFIISVITLFPEVFETVLKHSILKRAVEKELVEFKVINHRDFGRNTSLYYFERGD